MSIHGHEDDRFHENLRAVGKQLAAPAAPSPELIARCRSILEQAHTPNWRMRMHTYRKPLAWSACGLAAALILMVTMWIPGSIGSQAQAAMILSKLNEQIAAQPLLDITIEAIDMDDLSVNGHIQVAPSAAAGDMRISAGAPGERVELDVSMAISEESGWMMIRKLDIPDAQARALLSLFLTPGQEALVLFPKEVTADGFGAEFTEALEEFRSGELVKMAKVFQQLSQTSADSGATVVNQADGTLLLTLPLHDEQAIESLAEILGQFDHLEVSAELGDDEESEDEGEGDDDDEAATSSRVEVKIVKEAGVQGAVSGDDDAAKLVGATVSVIYDPALEQVRSVSISDLGRAKGRVSVELREGTIDPAWLAPERVTTPNTRIVDLQPLLGLLRGMTGESSPESEE